MESDIFINSESLRIRIPKQNITDSELEISDSPNSLLSEGTYISDVSSICDRYSPIEDTTGRNCPQFEHINQIENKTFTPIKFIDENLTPTPPPPLSPSPPPPPPLEEDLISSDENPEENIVPVLNLYSLTSPNELRIEIRNVEQINEDIEPKINLLREIGSSILLTSVIVLVSPVLIVILIMYFITKCFFS